MSDVALLEINGLSKIYPNGYEALKDVSFVAHAGEFICIIGRSGAGKSTLLRCINGLIPTTQGSIKIQNTDITTLRESEQAGYASEDWFYFPGVQPD